MWANAILQWVALVALAVIVLDITLLLYRRPARDPGRTAGPLGRRSLCGTSWRRWLRGVIPPGAAPCIAVVTEPRSIGWWRIRSVVPTAVAGIPVRIISEGKGAKLTLRTDWRGQHQTPFVWLVDSRGTIVRSDFVNTVERWTKFSDACAALVATHGGQVQLLGPQSRPHKVRSEALGTSDGTARQAPTVAERE